MADLDNGAVVNVGEYARVIVQGDGNVFEGNMCGVDGGVFASTSDSLVVVEGGTFKENGAGEVGRFRWGFFVFPKQRGHPLAWSLKNPTSLRPGIGGMHDGVYVPCRLRPCMA